MTVSITVTEFSRGLSGFLSQVQHRGQSLDIQRGKQIVAHVSPARATAGFPLHQLDDWLANASALTADESQSMVRDLRTVRQQLVARDDPWAS